MNEIQLRSNRTEPLWKFLYFAASHALKIHSLSPARLLMPGPRGRFSNCCVFTGWPFCRREGGLLIRMGRDTA